MKVNFKTSRIIYLAVFITVISIIISLGINNNKRSYRQMALDWRAQKNNYFRINDNSPMVNRDSFTTLSYFDPDIKYKIKAHVTKLQKKDTVTMLRTDGERDQYLKYAITTFALAGKEYQLTLYKSLRDSINKNVMFVPFTDNSNGETTYKAGRYMDIELTKPDEVTIDFNYAYNPFCAYNPRFSCPIPPAENHLDTQILAGEKYFEKSE